MKAVGQIAIGIAIAFLGALLWEQFSSWRQSDTQVVDVTFGPLVSLPRAVIADISKAEEGEAIRTIIFTNEGSQDLDNLTIEIASKKLPGISSVPLVEGLAPAEKPEMTIVDGRATIHFNLFKRKESAILWLRSPALSDLDFRSTKKGLVIHSPTDPVPEKNSLFMAVAVAAASLFGGAVAFLSIAKMMEKLIQR